MHTLTFDVEAAKAQLTQVFRDRIDAQGSVYNVLNVDIEDVSFDDLEKKLPNQQQILADIKSDLKTAQNDGEQWFNEIQPHLTAIPQASINYASLWNNTIPLVLAQLRRTTPDREELQKLFQGLKDSIDQQTAVLGELMTNLQSIRAVQATDAANFSDKHASFQQLEALDQENLVAARNTLDKIKAMIDQLGERIDIDTINAEKDLALASNAMKYGKKLGKPGKILGLTIGLIFIVSASFAIDDLLSTIDQRLEDAEKAGEYELEISLLNAQLVALETASSSLSLLVNELDDLIASLQATISAWNNDGNAIAAIIADLQGDAPIYTVINQFDLGRTQAQWDEISVFAGKWQTMEVSPKAANVLTLDGPDA